MSGAVGPAPPSEPGLSEAQRTALAEGLDLFNRRLFFECHDTLEEVWSGVRGAPRAFLQGLIQAAVGFYHLGNGNRKGALSMLRRSLERLERYPERYAGVELEPLRADLREWRQALEADSGPPAEPPRIRSAARPA